ncbi:MAG: hypothetical protein LC685_04240 [Actinobacteria bacterium]|nr:hypothetical protein [Actinomycetota bacterium]
MLAQQPAPEVDHATLAPVVAALLGVAAVPRSWTVTQIVGPNLGLAAGISRVAGDTVDGRSWSVVLKVLQPVPESFLARYAAADRADLERVYLWDREARAYTSGLLDDLPRGFAAARCFGIHEREDTKWLWLEDLGSRGWVRAWVLQGMITRQLPLIEDDAFWIDPVVLAAFGSGTRQRLRRAWSRRTEALDRLDALPRSLSHLDAIRGNLFSRAAADGAEETVGIDWAYLGFGAMGAEPAQLAMASAMLEGQDHRALCPLALEEYIGGLRDVGWRGDEGDVRRGFALSAIRWVFGLSALRAVTDPKRREAVARSAGRSYDEILAHNGDRTRYLLDLLDGALAS